MRKPKWLFLLALAWLALAGRAGTATAAPALQGANLLTNPSFERPFSSGLATGWGAWHQELNSNPKPANCSAAYSVRPGWFEENNQALLTNGFSSQHVGNQFDTWRGGVFQDVAATPGTTYRFSVKAWGRGTNDQYPAPSDRSVSMTVRVGVDPNGGGLWTSPEIVWGGTVSPHDAWQTVSVDVTATGAAMSVFIDADFRGANNCRAHLDIWFDEASLTTAAPPPTNTPPPPPPPPPAPRATNTPIPPTETPTPAATDTPEPPTPTPTATPPQGGVICLNAFADADANGVHDAGEAYMANVTFTVAQGSNVVATGVSRGTDNPVCFESIPAGTYLVAQSVPPTLEMTTAASAELAIEDGRSVGVEFGSRVKVVDEAATAEAVAAAPEAPLAATPTTAAAEDAPADTGGVDPLALSGLAAIVVAIILLGVLIFILLRQQGART